MMPVPTNGDCGPNICGHLSFQHHAGCGTRASLVAAWGHESTARSNAHGGCQYPSSPHRRAPHNHSTCRDTSYQWLVFWVLPCQALYVSRGTRRQGEDSSHTGSGDMRSRQLVWPAATSGGRRKPSRVVCGREIEKIRKRKMSGWWGREIVKHGETYARANRPVENLTGGP